MRTPGARTESPSESRVLMPPVLLFWTGRFTVTAVVALSAGVNTWLAAEMRQHWAPPPPLPRLLSTTTCIGPVPCRPPPVGPVLTRTVVTVPSPGTIDDSVGGMVRLPL